MRASFTFRKLMDRTKIKNNVLFVGLGKTFQIWEPKISENSKLWQEKSFQNDLT